MEARDKLALLDRLERLVSNPPNPRLLELVEQLRAEVEAELGRRGMGAATGLAATSLLFLGSSDVDDPSKAAARHREAAQTPMDAAKRHDQAADFWTEQGDGERASLERRNAKLEREAARLELDRAELLELQRSSSN